jgi:hypothetical protein
MKKTSVAALLFALCASFATQSFAANDIEPNEAQLSSHKHYVNKSGQSVHSPSQSVDSKVPSGASA